MDNRMLALWATPRSTSTAFEWMMRQRGDFRCLHEPFGVPYYRGADRRTTRFDENPQDMSITYASTWQDVQREHRKGRVFIKDFPNYIMHMADSEFPGPSPTHVPDPASEAHARLDVPPLEYVHDGRVQL